MEEMGSGFAVSEGRQCLGGGAWQADAALPAVGLQEQAENFWALVEGKGSGRVARVWPLGVPCSCSLAWPFHQSPTLGSPLAPPALCTPCPCSGQIVRDHLLLEALGRQWGTGGLGAYDPRCGGTARIP